MTAMGQSCAVIEAQQGPLVAGGIEAMKLEPIDTLFPITHGSRRAIADRSSL
jgi:hypothetical protein